jgi:lactase-phlorizin hydrolase
MSNLCLSLFYLINYFFWRFFVRIGEVGITLNINMALPFSESLEDVAAAEREMQFFLGWFAHPIFKNGNYPQIMIDKVSRERNQSNHT